MHWFGCSLRGTLHILLNYCWEISTLSLSSLLHSLNSLPPILFSFYCTLTHFLGLQMKFTLHSFIYFTHQNNSGERNLFQWVDVGLFCHGFGESAWCKEVGIPVLQCKLLHNPVIPQEKLTRLGKQRVYSSQGQCFVLFFSLLLQQDRGLM